MESLIKCRLCAKHRAFHPFLEGRSLTGHHGEGFSFPNSQPCILLQGLPLPGSEYPALFALMPMRMLLPPGISDLGMRVAKAIMKCPGLQNQHSPDLQARTNPVTLTGMTKNSDIRECPGYQVDNVSVFGGEYSYGKADDPGIISEEISVTGPSPYLFSWTSGLYHKIHHTIHQLWWRDNHQDPVDFYDTHPVCNQIRFSSVCSFHSIRIFS